MEELTVGKLKQTLQNVPDNVIVKLTSDTGIDQGCGAVLVLDAGYVNEPLFDMQYFSIYANDIVEEGDDE